MYMIYSIEFYKPPMLQLIRITISSDPIYNHTYLLFNAFFQNPIHFHVFVRNIYKNSMVNFILLKIYYPLVFCAGVKFSQCTGIQEISC